LQAVLTSEDYDFCMQTRFKWPFFALVSIPVVLVTHTVLGKPLVQSERAPKILQTAKSWRTGDPLPAELRRLRESESDIPGPMDSRSLIAEVRNLPLLVALVVDSGADPECREDALSQGIEVGGPNRFFELLRSQLSIDAAKDIQPWVNEVVIECHGPTLLSTRYSFGMRTCRAKRLLL